MSVKIYFIYNQFKNGVYEENPFCAAMFQH
jgi:hypothetical protein